jgi:hypothetical protein
MPPAARRITTAATRSMCRVRELSISKTFAIVIDEAHSSQGGKTSAAMSEALGGAMDGDEEKDPEDTVMQHLLRDDTQVYKQFVENQSFKRFVRDMVYELTNQV